MKKTLALRTLIFCFFLTTPVLAQEPIKAEATKPSGNTNLREVLVNSELTNKVIAIDEQHSHVLPVISSFGLSALQIPSDFTKLLINSCDTKWMVKGFDPFTSKIGWVPYDGKSNLYSREIEDKVTKKKETVNGAMCVDRFEIVNVWGTWREASSKGYYYFLPQSFMVKHNFSQPTIYKNTNIPSTPAMLPAGDITSLKPGESSKGFFAALVGKDKPDSNDIFQYLSLLCANNNGKIRGLANEGVFVPDPRGRTTKDGIRGYWKDSLSEVSVPELYRHAFAGGYKNTGLEKEWYFACEGSPSFLAREREKINKDNYGNYSGSSLTAIFAPDRGLTGIDFNPKK